MKHIYISSNGVNSKFEAQIYQDAEENSSDLIQNILPPFTSQNYKLAIHTLRAWFFHWRILLNQVAILVSGCMREVESSQKIEENLQKAEAWGIL